MKTKPKGKNFRCLLSILRLDLTGRIRPQSVSNRKGRVEVDSWAGANRRDTARQKREAPSPPFARFPQFLLQRWVQGARSRVDCETTTAGVEQPRDCPDALRNKVPAVPSR